MHSFTLPFIVALGIPLASSSTLGLDGSLYAIGTSNFTCLKKEGYSSYISRIWLPSGAYDSVGIQNIKNAWAGGIPQVDAYINPCTMTSCASAANQVEAALNKLKAEEAKIGQIWLEVSDENVWNEDAMNANRQFITDMANKAVSMGYSVGIFTNYYSWETFVGLDWTEMSKYPLWWQHEDGIPDFSRFPAFGGWSKPNIHQYVGVGKNFCITSMARASINWYP